MINENQLVDNEINCQECLCRVPGSANIDVSTIPGNNEVYFSEIKLTIAADEIRSLFGGG